LLGLPDLTGLTDTATIQLSPFNTQTIDVIKIQALVSATTGTASTSGFGDSFATAPAPEPGTILLAGIGLCMAGVWGRRRKATKV
jgi:hypothetical protein